MFPAGAGLLRVGFELVRSGKGRGWGRGEGERLGVKQVKRHVKEGKKCAVEGEYRADCSALKTTAVV